MVSRDDPRLRLLAILLLLGLHLGMFLDYGQYLHGCPNPACFASDYDDYVGQSHRIGGTIIDTDPLTLGVEYAPGRTLDLTLLGMDATVSEGDRVVVYGTLAPDRSMRVIDFIVHPASNLRYMYSISFFALVIVVGLGLKFWRFDPDDLVFRRRGEY